jgi:hypothetical protein
MYPPYSIVRQQPQQIDQGQNDLILLLKNLRPARRDVSFFKSNTILPYCAFDHTKLIPAVAHENF